MDFDHVDQLRDLARQPPAPPKPRERSAWGALPRGLGAMASELFSDVAGLRVQEDPPERRRIDPFRIPDLDAMRSDSRAKNEAMATGARDFARSLRPDPATASTAESVVFGVARGVSKAAAAVVAAGPAAGAVVFGASEAAAINDDLAREGVDPGTRAKVAALTGVAGAASVLLPMSGPTLRSTAALYLAGGPGGFIAQQAGTREILQQAGYAEQAARFDPFDPVGLTLSALVPLPFAAAGALRNVRAARAGDVGDAAMVHNLTVHQDGIAAAVRAGEPPMAIPETPPMPAPVVRAAEPAAPVSSAPEAITLGRLTDAVDTARQQMDAAKAAGRTLDQFLADNPMPPEVNNVMLGLKAAADDPRRMAALMQRLAREAADEAKPAADATADAVQGVMALTDQQLRDIEAPPKPTADALTQQTVARVDRLRAEQPDLVTRVTDDGQQVRVADDLDAARRLAREGTDTELGTLDADLLRVAAECALSLGGT